MIFQDFDMKLPPMTNYLIRIGSFFFNYSYLLLPLFAASPIAVRIYDPAILRRDAMGHSADEPAYAAARFGADPRQSGSGCAAAAAVVRGHCRDGRLLSQTGDTPPSKEGRLRYRSGRRLGREPRPPQVDPPADHAVLQAAQRVGNLPWAMQEMADSARRRFFYRLQGIIQTVFPFAVVGFGSTIRCSSS